MNVKDWLLDSDPSIRWQVLRDLTDAPTEPAAAERSRIATEGWGARLLALQGEDGHWSKEPPTFSSPAWEEFWRSIAKMASSCVSRRSDLA